MSFKLIDWFLFFVMTITLVLGIIDSISDINIAKTISNTDTMINSAIRYATLSFITPIVTIGPIMIPGLELIDIIPIITAIIISKILKTIFKLNRLTTIILTVLLALTLFTIFKIIIYNIYIYSSAQVGITKELAQEVIIKMTTSVNERYIWGYPLRNIVYLAFLISAIKIGHKFNLFGLKGAF